MYLTNLIYLNVISTTCIRTSIHCEHVQDRALLRPGRFDSIIYLGLPTNETVKRIVEKRLLEKTQIDLKPFIERVYFCLFCTFIL